MNGIARHKACRLCRDRKIRCDGEQPACEKCRNSGEICVYGATQKPTRSDLVHTIETLQKRLEEAESVIRRMNRQTSPSHGPSAEQQSLETIQQQQRHNEISQEAFFETPWTMSEDFANSAPYQCPMTDFRANDDGSGLDLSPQSYSGFFIQRSKETPVRQTSQITAQDVRDTSLDLCCTQSVLAKSAGLQQQHKWPCQAVAQENQQEQTQQRAQQFQQQPSRAGSGHANQHFTPAVTEPNISPTIATSGSGMMAHHSMYSSNGPTLTQTPQSIIVAATGNAFDVHDSDVELTDIVQEDGNTSHDDQSPRLAETNRAVAGTASDLISAEIKTFSTAVFQGQAELAGMAAALSGYLDWMRKVPSGSSPPNTKPVFVNVLETLQERLMELSELAQTKHQRAFKEMIAALEKGDDETMPLHVKDRGGPLCSMIASDLAGVGDDAVMRGREVYDFFQTKYNACAMLSEQTAKLRGSIDAKDSGA